MQRDRDAVDLKEMFQRVEEAKKNRKQRVWVEVMDGVPYVVINSGQGFNYEFELSRIKTAAQALDWIHQICVAKTWGREMCLDILDALFYDGILPTSMWSGKA